MFYIFKKREKIEAVYASEYIDEDNIFLMEAIKNDVFNVAPYLDLIYELEEA
ncbi:hypothetical protein VYE96_06190 [Fusobacterium pseudoperiodonticum]|nr:hypothetical protein [Fusobacterium pseudoperiodonticum]